MKSVSTIFDNIDMKEFSVSMLIDYPVILPSIEEVDRVMKQFADKLSGNDRIMFEDNCLERIAELLLKEKGELCG